jgi:hypothetical protein
MSTEKQEQRDGALTHAAEAVAYVQRLTLPPADWDEVAGFLRRMQHALDRDDLDELRRQRDLLEKLVSSSRQVARARLDPGKVEPPPLLRSAAENLSRKIEAARTAKGDAGKDR